VVSWGWGENFAFTTGSKYLDYFEWSGTHDPSAYLSVPAAIQFQADHHWPAVQQRCQQILADGLKRIDQLTGLESIYSDRATPFVQMAVVRLPRVREISAFQRELLQQYRIEVPCIEWNGQHFIRISVQAYNTEADIDALVAAVEALLPQFKA
jgi:isopenicillin-N epimerase